MKSKNFTYGIGIRISIGFVFVLLLLVLLTLTGLSQIAKINVKMQEVVEVNNVKIALAQVMEQALHQRALSMHSIAVLEDDFLKDEEYMHFNNMGTKYYRARKSLSEMITTAEEKEILAVITSLTITTQPVVQKVVELGLNETTSSHVYDAIREQALPRQQRIAEEVDKLVLLQKKQAQAALIDAQAGYKNTRNVMFLLLVLTIAISIGIAVYVIRRVTEQAKLLEHHALHDELTNLPNRLLFQDRLQKAILRAQRHSGSFSIILIDLDRFKAVNDTLGHKTGDLLLKEVALRLKKHVRKVDTVARLGGDEYVIILDALPQNQVVSIAEKLSQAIQEPYDLEGKSVDIGVSMGIASYPAHGNDCTTLLHKADVAMYSAKRSQVAFQCYAGDIKQT